jgi:hypothetical protein
LLADSENWADRSSLIATESGVSQEGILQQRISPAVRRRLIELGDFGQVLCPDDFDIGYDRWRSRDRSWGYVRWAEERLEKMGTLLPERLRRAAALMRDAAATVDDEPADDSRCPVWRDGLLTYRGQHRKYRRPAPRQRPVLDCFQAKGWPTRVKNPFTTKDKDDKDKADYRGLKNGVDDLNKTCKEKRIPIKFLIEDDGAFVSWQSTSGDNELEVKPTPESPTALKRERADN